MIDFSVWNWCLLNIINMKTDLRTRATEQKYMHVIVKSIVRVVILLCTPRYSGIGSEEKNHSKFYNENIYSFKNNAVDSLVY